MLKRCMDSVRRQTTKVDHMLVADGFPQDWISTEPVRHLILDRPHADYGDVARGVGALTAVAEKYDGIAFLDAEPLRGIRREARLRRHNASSCATMAR